MDIVNQVRLDRRSVLGGGGALVLSFSMFLPVHAQQTEIPSKVELPGSLDDTRILDAWVRIDASGNITIFTGKAELGQGIRTALIQLAAEELLVEFADIVLITADTGATPNEGFTAGSQSMQNSGTAIRHAAAQVRVILQQQAASQWNTQPQNITASGKHMVAPDGRRLSYGELAAKLNLHVDAQPQSDFVAAQSYRLIGKPIHRIDIPRKVTGEVAYVQDLRLEGMLHARVVRPPSYGYTISSVDVEPTKALPGIVSVVQDGDFLAVVADEEFQAVRGMALLQNSTQWHSSPAQLPDIKTLPAVLQSLEREVGTVSEAGNANGAGEDKIYEATFTRPYQIHGSIGPSCAVAQMQDGTLTIWSHTQGVYPDRKAIAEMLGMPEESVRVIHMEGSGCYGHNGADDAAADAALIARSLNGRPVRVQWMREQEHAWEPYGPAMLMKVKASLSTDGTISSWSYDLWSNTHSTRPGGAGALLAGRQSSRHFQSEQAKLQISPNGNGDRNADPLYTIPNKRVFWHFLPDMPLRVSALRALGAYANVFAIESTMDELAVLAQADPVEFRLKNLADQRARKVVELAAERFGWSQEPLSQGVGRGFAFARYKNHAAYLAVAIEASVDRVTGRVQVDRVVAAIDSGEVVNPDGIRNQTEGGILQSLSWTLFEQVKFTRDSITSTDWSSYPILRFGSVPSKVEVHIVDRPNDPFLGTGEAAQGPTAAAISNAVRNATGVRFVELPLTRDKVKAGTIALQQSL